MNLHGLLIDPQQDFCDPQTGTLYVPGAEHDMRRLAGLLQRLGSAVAALHITLDSHQVVDIAHPVWWRDQQNKHPDPFTIITTADIDAGRWTTTRPDALPRSRAYVAALEAEGRYPLCIWPYHCLTGTPGQAVVPALFAAVRDWTAATGTPVDWVIKGGNPWTEHYSAINAEVPDPSDPATQVNTALVEKLRCADMVFVAGEAGSHCVANTVRDLADSLDDDRLLSKFVLLTDAFSPVTGFEAAQADFVREMTARGMRTATTETWVF